MLTTRNLWIMLIGSALLVAVFWFGAYHQDHRPELPPALGEFPDLTFTGTEAAVFDRTRFNNRVTAISLATVACPEACQDGLIQLSKLRKLMKNHEAFQTATIGIGFHGQFALLQAMVKRLSFETSGWHFAVELENGETVAKINQQLEGVSIQQLKLSSIMVVDGRGSIRGVYETNDKFAVVQLQNDIYNLLKAPVEAFTVSQREGIR